VKLADILFSVLSLCLSVCVCVCAVCTLSPVFNTWRIYALSGRLLVCRLHLQWADNERARPRLEFTAIYSEWNLSLLFVSAISIHHSNNQMSCTGIFSFPVHSFRHSIYTSRSIYSRNDARIPLVRLAMLLYNFNKSNQWSLTMHRLIVYCHGGALQAGFRFGVFACNCRHSDVIWLILLQFQIINIPLAGYNPCELYDNAAGFLF